jgi:hypothetical protein
MRIIDAKTEKPVELDGLHRLLIKAYFDLWVDAYGSSPTNWHPIPINVGQDDVQAFISFSEHQE